MKEIIIKGTVVNDEDKAVYDWLGYESISPDDIRQALTEANGEPVKFIVNSGGGDVFAGNEINYIISQYEGETTADVVGLAASIATVICCGADKVRAIPSAQYMIHNVSSGAYGDYRDMDKASEILQKANRSISAAYESKTGLNAEQLLELMDRETWLTSKEALELGFIDEIITNNATRLYNGAMVNIVPTETIAKIKNQLLKASEEKEAEEPSEAADDSSEIFIIKEKAKLNLLRMRGAH